MRRAVVCAVVAFFAVMLQLTFVDRLALPGGTVPDLVLVVVIALGLTQGPATGMLAGFFAGLGLDLAPPGSHLIGASALIFCLLGYGCGRLTSGQGRSAVWLFAVAALAAAIGETLQATAGIIGDRGVTLPAVRQVLPAAVLYDALLTLVVVVLVAFSRSARSRRARAERKSGLAGRKSGNVPAGQPPARLAGLGARIPAAAFRSGSAQRGGQPAQRGGPQLGHRGRSQLGHRGPARLHMSESRRRSRVNRSGGFRGVGPPDQHSGGFE